MCADSSHHPRNGFTCQFKTLKFLLMRKESNACWSPYIYHIRIFSSATESCNGTRGWLRYILRCLWMEARYGTVRFMPLKTIFGSMVDKQEYFVPQATHFRARFSQTEQFLSSKNCRATIAPPMFLKLDI